MCKIHLQRNIIFSPVLTLLDCSMRFPPTQTINSLVTPISNGRNDYNVKHRYFPGCELGGGGGRMEGTCNDTPLRRHRFSLETHWVKATILKLKKNTNTLDSVLLDSYRQSLCAPTTHKFTHVMLVFAYLWLKICTAI